VAAPVALAFQDVHRSLGRVRASMPCCAPPGPRAAAIHRTAPLSTLSCRQAPLRQVWPDLAHEWLHSHPAHWPAAVLLAPILLHRPGQCCAIKAQDGTQCGHTQHRHSVNTAEACFSRMLNAAALAIGPRVRASFAQTPPKQYRSAAFTFLVRALVVKVCLQAAGSAALQGRRRPRCPRAGMVTDTAASPAAEETSAQARLMDEYRGTAVGAALGAEYDSVTASKPKHRRAGAPLLIGQDLPLPGTARLEQAPWRLCPHLTSVAADQLEFWTDGYHVAALDHCHV